MCVVDRLSDSPDCQVDCLHSDSSRVDIGGMADHVAPGEICSEHVEASALDCSDRGVRGFGRLHPRPLIERHDVGGDLEIRLQFVVELARSVAVPEVRDVTELLGLGHTPTASIQLRR